MFTYQPPYYEIEVVFKPKNVPSYKASEFREVSFRVDSEKSRDEYFDIARQKAVSDGVVSEYVLKYWEAFRVRIDCPSPPRQFLR